MKSSMKTKAILSGSESMSEGQKWEIEWRRNGDYRHVWCFCRSNISRVRKEERWEIKRDGKFHFLIQMMFLHLRKHFELLIICEQFSCLLYFFPKKSLPYILISHVNKHVAKQGADFYACYYRACDFSGTTCKETVLIVQYLTCLLWLSSDLPLTILKVSWALFQNP